MRLPRIPPLLLLLLAGGLLHGAWFLLPSATVSIPGGWWLAGALGLLALLLVASANGLFRRARTTVDPRDPRRSSALVTSGVFRLSRNPMYLAFGLVLLGWALVLGHAAALLVLPAFLLYLDRVQIPAEEQALAELFGQDYADYCRRVRRWL